MSYPDTKVAERWVPVNSKGGDPLVLNGLPYVVLLGYVDDPCANCPEYQIRDVAGTDHYFTTVHTVHARSGFTVVVNAEVALEYDQDLFIHPDSEPGNVILTNSNPTSDRDFWGRVFAFGITEGWLREGDVSMIGFVEGVMIDRKGL